MTENQNDIAGELALLQRLTGIEFSHKLEQICKRGEFHPVRNEPDIYTAISEMDNDYNALLAAAKRAGGHALLKWSSVGSVLLPRGNVIRIVRIYILTLQR